MTFRLFIAILFLGTVVSAGQPSVLLVTVEGLGWSDLESSEVPLPHLTALLKESAVLRDFHVSPLDAPSRAALLTGLEPFRAGVWGNHSGRHRLRGDLPGLASLLKSAGYRTGLFGTWALGDTVPSRPQDHGYERVLTHGGSLPGSVADAFSNDGVDDIWMQNGEPVVHPGTWTQAVFRGASAWLDEGAAGQPFFCHLAPSRPAGMPEQAVESFRRIEGAGNPFRAAWLTELDAAMGSLIGQLKKSDRAAQTIVLVTSTSGAPYGGKETASTSVRRGHRGSPYEAGHRVPLLVHWPENVRAGDVVLPAMHFDLLPTLAALTGITTAAPVAADGISLVPWLTRDTAAPDPPLRTLITDAQEIPVPVRWRRQCVMSGNWRLINGRELYDLREDPAQRRNLAGTNPDIVGQLRESAEAWWQRLAPDKLEPVRAVVGGVQDPVVLTPLDWLARGGVAITRSAVMEGAPANSRWMLEIASAGNYDILLRRWPLTVNRTLADAFFNPDKARIRIGAEDQSKDVPPGADGVNFRVALKAGPVTLQTWLAGEGRSSGAYFVEIRRGVEVRRARPVP
jgi:arylsulfatase A-like enzyme